VSGDLDHFFVENQALGSHNPFLMHGNLQGILDLDAMLIEPEDLAVSQDVDSTISLRTGTNGDNSIQEAGTFDRFKILSDVVSSRAPSPRSTDVQRHWLSGKHKVNSGLFSLQHQEIINELIGLFKSHVAETMTLFRGKVVLIDNDTPKAWYFAMGAVGALFCPRKGSSQIANYLYNSARRHVNSAVSPCLQY
jgi:hypothetical protein